MELNDDELAVLAAALFGRVMDTAQDLEPPGITFTAALYVKLKSACSLERQALLSAGEEEWEAALESEAG